MLAPKSIMPSTAYMYIIRRSRAPMFTSYCKVITKVLNIICRLLPPRLSRRRILKILNDLINVTVPLISRELYRDMMMPIAEATATVISKMFQPSLKKTATPCPINLMTASMTKIPVNT
jgi:hypothetical protein